MTQRPTVIVLLALAAAAANAQRPAYAATAAQADSAMDVSLARVIQGASARGIPAGPLLAKVREGRLKRAALPRIHTALAALVARLDSSRAALGPAATADELTAGADALAAGADAGSLRAIREAAAGRSASAPLGALAQLVASGIPSPRAVSMVVDLLRRRASPAQVLAFGNLVESDVSSGLPAEESAVLRLHSFDSRSGDLRTTAPSDMPSVPGGSIESAFRPPVSPPSPPSPPPAKTPKRRP